jgi:hypothetical protein
MTESAFSQALRRGLGSAIVKLKEHPDSDKYRGIVLRCCLHDISYDWQVEGTKGHYLYSAICALGDKDYFEKILIDKFLSRCPDGLFRQLTDILFCCARNGSESAKDAFRAKYDYFVAKNGRLTKPFPLDEGYQWSSVACSLFDIDGFAAFKRYALDMGELLHRKPDRSNLYYYDYDYFISEAENKFGKKRTNNFLAKMYEKSDSIKALIDTLKEDDLSREQHRKNAEQEKVTIDVLLRTAREAALSEINHYGAMMRLRRPFMQNASDGEVLKLARAILYEDNETVKGLLLRIFWHKPFPLGAAPLLEYAQSNNGVLSENALSLLEELRDKRIHDLALQLLKEKGFDSLALGLLKKNYRKTDDDIIHKLINKASSIPHHVQTDLGDIYRHHRSVNALSILLRAYQKGDCSFCRYGIVKAMRHCGVLSDEILGHCLYDSYEDTRRFAKRLIETKPQKEQFAATVYR